MTPAKAGDQGVEAETCLWKPLKRRRFPVFGFSAGWNLALGRSKRRLPEKNCALEDQGLGGRDMLCLIQEPKWKSRFEAQACPL